MEIQKEEMIELAVEKYYKNFPELIEKFSVEKIYKILNKNISKIVYIDSFEDKNVHGMYVNNEVRLLKPNDIHGEFEALVYELKVLHEVSHALFKHGRTSTGCQARTQDIRKIKIYGPHLTELSQYKSPKNVMEKIRILAIWMKEIQIHRPVKRRALNEGLTDWIVLKSAGFRACSAYDSANIIGQLECFESTKNVLSLADGVEWKMPIIFNMDSPTFSKFCKMLDIKLAHDKYMLSGLIDNDTEKERLKETIRIDAFQIQKMMLEKVIIPGIKETLNSRDINKNGRYKKIANAEQLINNYLKGNDIDYDFIKDDPTINEYLDLYDKIEARNNKEFIEQVESLKGDNEKINIFELFNAIEKHMPININSGKTIAEMTTGKKLEKEDAIKFINEVCNLQKNERCKITGEENKNKEVKFEIIDRDMFTYEFREKLAEEKKQRKTLLRKFVEKAISSKKITKEQVDKCELEEIDLKQEKGGKGIEK